MLRRIALGISILALLGVPAAAQQLNFNPARCLPHDEMLKHLASHYQEKPVAIGVGDNGALLELFATADGATWTALVTRANGVSCVVMNGDSWQYTLPQTMARLPIRQFVNRD